LAAGSCFFNSNYPLLAPKIPLFNGYFALFSHVFHASKEFCLYHCNVFLCFSTCILLHFALHLAPKHLAFCTILPCVLHQNTLRLAPKCTAFCGKTHYILLQITQKLDQMGGLCNKYTSCRIRLLTTFGIENNLRENRFFAAR